MKLNLGEFEKLEEVESEEREKLNWSEVFKKMGEGVYSFREIKEFVWNEYGKILYRSVLENVVLRLSKGEDGVRVLSKRVRVGGRVRRLYGVIIEG